ncbi:hypothetical protein LguiA_022498 [Lonicera macranthoides]
MKVSAFPHANTTKKMMNSEQEDDSEDLELLSRIDVEICSEKLRFVGKDMFKAIPPANAVLLVAAWIVEDSNVGDSDNENEDEDGMVLGGTETSFSGQVGHEKSGLDNDQASLNLRDSNEETEADSVMMEGENLTKEQIEDEIRKIKDAHAEGKGVLPNKEASSLLASGLLEPRHGIPNYPQRVSKSKATVRCMFHNPEDVKWFKIRNNHPWLLSSLKRMPRSSLFQGEWLLEMMAMLLT